MSFTVKLTRERDGKKPGSVVAVTRDEGLELVCGKVAKWDPPLVVQDAAARDVAEGAGASGEPGAAASTEPPAKRGK